MRTHAIRVQAVGGPEVLEWTEIDLPAPGPGELQLHQEAVGLNFIDVYHRTGLYPMPLPFIPGAEGAGVVTKVGPGVEGFQVGQRVAYAPLTGAYAVDRNVPAGRVVALPDGVSAEAAAASMLKGMTAEFLLRRCRPVGSGDTVVFHAAAGGVGQIAVPWARALGATVIGVVGSEAKVERARRAGAHHVLLQGAPDFVTQVKIMSGGRGADVVYDSVGKDTIQASLDCLRPRGTLVSFGQASGKPPPFDLASIGGPRSLYVTRPSLFAYVAERAELEESAAALFDVFARGVVPMPQPTRFALRDAAEAHRALEARETTGSVVLVA